MPSVVMLNVVMLSVAAPLNLVMQKEVLKAFLPEKQKDYGLFCSIVFSTNHSVSTGQ
jgi:hypothetical protein